MRFINLNCITNSCNWYAYVTWRGNEYEISEDETIVVIYKLIVFMLLLVVLQSNKNARYMY